MCVFKPAVLCAGGSRLEQDEVQRERGSRLGCRMKYRGNGAAG